MNNIPTITKNLLIVNVVVFLATYLFRTMGVDLNNVLGLHFFLAPDFHIYQLFTYMFAHGGFSHIFFNMFALWMFGCIVERTWGPKKFLTYYIVCGVGAGLFQELAQFYFIASEQLPHFTLAQTMKVANANAAFLNLWTTVGASGAVYGILLAFGMLYPEERIFIFPLPVPIKAKWFVMGYAAIELFMAYSSTGDGVAHLAHLGGMVFGFFLIRYWRRHPDIRYSRRSGQQFFDSMRASWERRTGRKDRGGVFTNSANTRHESDWDYNARRKAEQERMDEILDKIRRNGYESLTREEKQQLFDASNRK
ncbi:rhomboid family intramembrane serine protease [Leyella stercorea]|uniref:rhomboid family intramembrane serine protease n=1 Tax=Leyella stercorea TaxID=363265 RepID=UPI0026DB870B|nr:rhomboid family intramembrane serine protease [Leyella stercorea]